MYLVPGQTIGAGLIGDHGQEELQVVLKLVDLAL